MRILEDYPKDDVETQNEALQIAQQLGVDFSKVDKSEFIKGYDVEHEHGETVGNNKEIIAKITLDHLNEDPKYYTKLLSLGL